MVRKVLIADDDEGILALIQATLANDGNVEILMARDGDEALMIARQRMPDLIFLDLMMPRRDGLEVCQALKNDPTTASIRVVMLNGLSQELEHQKAVYDVGADGCIAKPFGPLELLREFEEIQTVDTSF